MTRSETPPEQGRVRAVIVSSNMATPGDDHDESNAATGDGLPPVRSGSTASANNVDGVVDNNGRPHSSSATTTNGNNNNNNNDDNGAGVTNTYEVADMAEEIAPPPPSVGMYPGPFMSMSPPTFVPDPSQVHLHPSTPPASSVCSIYVQYSRPCSSWKVLRDRIRTICPLVPIVHVKVVNHYSAVVRIRGHYSAALCITALNDHVPMDGFRYHAVLIDYSLQGQVPFAPMPGSMYPYGYDNSNMLAVPNNGLVGSDKTHAPHSPPTSPSQSVQTPSSSNSILDAPQSRSDGVLDSQTRDTSTGAGTGNDETSSFEPIYANGAGTNGAHGGEGGEYLDYWSPDAPMFPMPMAHNPYSMYSPHRTIPVVSPDFVPFATGYHRKMHNTTDRQKVFIKNIPYSTQWQDLKDFLRTGANIYHVELPQYEDGRPRGYAIATFFTEQDANEAVRKFHGSTFNGREIFVYHNNSRRPSKDGEDEDDNNNNDQPQQTAATAENVEGVR
uniref:ARAD1C09416p n=1 Tax=Blastobotrys adeninivorans TaxID=409370 RepID=A0A060T5Y8_BLAAD